jgi:hypothetical protein
MTISTQNLSLNAIVPTDLHFHTHFISRNEICKANEIALTKKGVATTNAAENVPKPISQKRTIPPFHAAKHTLCKTR